jgi:two-component system LytT family response regulator
MQLAFRSEPQVPVRMGLHFGDIIISDEQVFGDGVNFASRIESLGVAGAVLISDKVNNEIYNHPNIKTVSIGIYQLKNIERSVEVFAIDHKGLFVPGNSSLKIKSESTAKLQQSQSNTNDMLRSIIIDDEPQNAAVLKTDLTTHCSAVEVIGVCHSAKEGILAIKKEKPDLVFLDIEMPWMNGFEMLEMLDNINFSIIFTTAHDQFAAKAFRISAVDYLLKPIDANDLKEAVRKALHKNEQQHGNVHIENLLRNMRQPSTEQKIAFPQREGYEFVDVASIIYCQAEGAYTKIFMNDKKTMLISRTLGDVEELLPPELFQRIHHSTVVNVSHIAQFLRTDGGFVVLKNGEKLSVSKAKKEMLMARLGLKKD